MTTDEINGWRENAKHSESITFNHKDGTKFTVPPSFILRLCDVAQGGGDSLEREMTDATTEALNQ